MELLWGDTLRMAVFDIWSDYGHFRRGSTTTSPLTYPIPTRTAIAGTVAAILGIPRDSYYHLFDEKNSAIAVQILNPIRKTTINQNLIDTKTGFYLRDNEGQRTQIPYEFLKNPKFRIFVWLEDNKIFSQLCNLISERKTVYTLYMGLTEHIAQFSPYKGGCLPAKKIETHEKTPIHSVVPKEYAKIYLDPYKKDYVYGVVKVPGFMNDKRVVKKYVEIYYEERGKPLYISEGQYYSVGGEINIIPF